MSARLIAAAALALACAACARPRTASLPARLPPATLPPATPPSSAPEAIERGKASYYHDSLAGNHTANGDIYDPGGLTAAHRTLPFGTVVDVVRADGRYVRVRINDRGPFVSGRIIDLSRRAAEHIGMIREGVVDVTLYLIERPSR